MDNNGKLGIYQENYPPDEYLTVELNDVKYFIHPKHKINPFYALDNADKDAYLVVSELGDEYIVINHRFGHLEKVNKKFIKIVYTSEIGTYDDIQSKQKRLIID